MAVPMQQFAVPQVQQGTYMQPQGTYVQGTEVMQGTQVGPIANPYVEDQEPTAYEKEMKTFNIANGLTCLMMLVVFVLLISSIGVDWYAHELEYENRVTAEDGTHTWAHLNTTTFAYQLYGYRNTTVIEGTGDVTAAEGESTVDYADGDNDQLTSLFRTLLAFTIIGLVIAALVGAYSAALFVESIREAIHLKGAQLPRIVCAVGVLLVGVCVGIAFLGLFGINDAFDSDPQCGKALNQYGGYCKKFRDTAEFGHEFGVYATATWGPGAGWFLVFGCVPATLIALVASMFIKPAIPDEAWNDPNMAGQSM
jgi:hypothetical protein